MWSIDRNFERLFVCLLISQSNSLTSIFFLQQQFDSSKPNWTLRIVSDASAVSFTWFCLLLFICCSVYNQKYGTLIKVIVMLL